MPSEYQKDVIHVINRKQNGTTFTVGPLKIINRVFSSQYRPFISEHLKPLLIASDSEQNLLSSHVFKEFLRTNTNDQERILLL